LFPTFHRLFPDLLSACTRMNSRLRDTRGLLHVAEWRAGPRPQAADSTCHSIADCLLRYSRHTFSTRPSKLKIPVLLINVSKSRILIVIFLKSGCFSIETKQKFNPFLFAKHVKILRNCRTSASFGVTKSKKSGKYKP
jgi:hypothetical protein